MFTAGGVRGQPGSRRPPRGQSRMEATLLVLHGFRDFTLVSFVEDSLNSTLETKVLLPKMKQLGTFSIIFIFIYECLI